MNPLEHKSDSWLKVKQGKLCLCYPALPDLGCLLQAISETGCSGTVMFQYLPPEVSEDWKKIIAPQRPVSLKMDLPPWLLNFEAGAIVVRAQTVSDKTEIELAFNQLAPELRKQVRQAILSMAMKKVRKDNQADPEREGEEGIRDIPMLLKLKKIGEVLLHMGRLKPRQLEEALARARANHEKLGHFLVRTGMIKPDVLCRALALQSGLPMTDLSDAELSEKLAGYFDTETMIRHCFIPFDESESLLCVAAGSPLKTPVLQELEKHCGKKIELFLAEEELVAKLLENLPENRKKARQHERYTGSWAVRYQFCNRLGIMLESAQFEGLAGDISDGGLLIAGPASTLISPEDFKRRGICVRMELSTQPQPVRAFGQLRSMREKDPAPDKPAKDKRWLMGIEFLEVSAEEQRRLKELCIKAALNAGKKT